MNILHVAILRIWNANRLSKAYFIAFWLFGTALLSLGPALQFYSLAILNSNQSSIYASVYQNAVTTFPNLREWMTGLSYGIFSICATIVIVCSLHAETYRGVFLRAFISSAATLTILDLTSEIYNGTISLSGALTNLACNIAGALIIALILILVLRATKAISTATDDHLQIQQILAISFPPIVGFLAIVISFYITGLFFRLVPANIDITIQPDSRASVKFVEPHDLDVPSICNSGCEGDNNKQKQFGFFVGDGQIEDLASLRHAEGPLSLLWAMGKDQSKYSITISAVSGCYGLDQTKIKLLPSKSFRKLNAKKLSVEMDEGVGYLSLISPQSHLNVADSDAVHFYVSKSDSDAKNLKLTRLLKGSSSFDYWSSSPNYRIVFSAALAQGDEDSGIVPKSRTLKIMIDEKEYKLSLNSNSLGSLDKKTSCNVLDVSSFGKTNVSLLSNLSLDAGIIINIERQVTDDKVFYVKGSSITVQGANGWLSVDKVQTSSAKSFVQEGTIGELGFAGNVKNFQLNGAAVSSSELDWMAVSNAKLIGRMDQEGNMLFSGIGQNVWKGKNRLTQTRWENIDSSTQAVLLSLLGLCIATLFGFFVNSMRENKKVELL